MLSLHLMNSITQLRENIKPMPEVFHEIYTLLNASHYPRVTDQEILQKNHSFCTQRESSWNSRSKTRDSCIFPSGRILEKTGQRLKPAVHVCAPANNVSNSRTNCIEFPSDRVSFDIKTKLRVYPLSNKTTQDARYTFVYRHTRPTYVTSYIEKI